MSFLPSFLWAPRAAAPFVGVLDGRTDLAGAWGARRLRSAYAGPAMDVTRQGDNAAGTVAFNGAGNIDGSSVVTLSGGSTATLTAWLGTGYAFIDRVYDQSGAGNHATQATAAERPRLRLDRKVGPACGILILSSGRYLDGAAGNCWLSIPTTLTATARASTVFSVARQGNASTHLGAHISLRNAGFAGYSHGIHHASSVIAGSIATGTGNAQAASGRAAALSGAVAWTRSTGTQPQVRYRDAVVAQSAASTDANLAGGYIGGYSTTSAATPGVTQNNLWIGAVFVLNQSLAQTAADTLKTALEADFGLLTDAATAINYVADGDSITEGTGGTGGMSRPHYTADWLVAQGKAAVAINRGQHGDSIAGRATQIASAGTATFQAGETNIYSLLIGSNTIASSNGMLTDATTLFGADDTTTGTIRYIIAQAKAKGANRVLLGTVMRRTDVTGNKELLRQDLNARIIANAAALGYAVVDYAADSRLDPFVTPANFSDTTHPNDAGYQVMSQLERAVLAAVLP